MQVFWTTRTLGDVPKDLSWLHPAEREVVARFRFPKKRNDWLLGRWTAKSILLPFLHASFPLLQRQDIEVRAAKDGAPEVYCENEPLPAYISLSHSHGQGFCVVTAPGNPIGCDLEKLEARSPALINDHFTESERRLIEVAHEEQRLTYANLIWSAKESVLKTLRTGLSIDTRLIEVVVEDGSINAWQSFGAKYHRERLDFKGHWRVVEDYVLTVAATGKYELLEGGLGTG